MRPAARSLTARSGTARSGTVAVAVLLLTGLAGCSGSDDAAGGGATTPPAVVGSTAGPDVAAPSPPSSEASGSGTPVEPSGEASSEATAGAGGAGTAGPAGTVEAPSGAVPVGWEPVAAPDGPVFALPAGFQTQDVGEVAEGVTVVLHASPDGSVVVQDQRFSGAQFADVVPEELLLDGVEGGIAGGGLAAEDRRDFQVQGRPASEFRAPDPSGTGAYVAARFVADGGVLLGFIATRPDEDAAVAALDQAWDTLRLP